MSRMIIVSNDQMIGVNGLFLKCSFTPEEKVHAIQVYDDHAEVEYNDGRMNEILQGADLQAIVNKYLPIYNNQKLRVMPPNSYSKFDEQTQSWKLDIDVLRSQVRQNILAMRSEALQTGVEFEGNLYQADPVSYGNLTGAVAAVTSVGLALPEGFCWRTADDKNIPMDAETLIALGTAMLGYVNYCYAHSWELKTRADNAQTEEELKAIVW